MSGRALPTSQFAGDDGSPDPALQSALDRWAEDRAREPEVLHALAAARVLVPVVARMTEAEQTAGGRTVEKTTTMSLVSLVGEDGRRILPVFSGLAALSAWDVSARPVAVPASRAALSAAAEGASVLVLDLAGPRRYAVGGPVLRRLAEGDPLTPLYDDPEVLAAVRDLVDVEEAVRAAWLVPGADLDAQLDLMWPTGTDPQLAVETASRLALALQASDTIRSRVVRGLGIGVAPAGYAAGGRRAVLDRR